MNNVDQTSHDIEQHINGLAEYTRVIQFEVAPCFEGDAQTSLIEMSESAAQSIRELQGLSIAIIASLRFSLRNVSTVARDAVMFHQQQISMRVQNRFDLDPELAQLVIDWLTGEVELPEGVSDTNAVSALLWLISDLQEALEGLVYEDYEGAWQDAS